MSGLLQDLRYAARTLLKSRGFAIIAILTLALGIGPLAALFSAMGGVLLRPLPFERPEELVWIWEQTPQGRQSTTSAANFLEWRRSSNAFSEMAAYDFLGFDLGGPDRPENIVGAAVSANLFSVLGVQASLGRTFAAEKEQPGRRVVVISDRLWQRRFGSDPKIAGREIILNDRTYTVIGVLPKNFWFFLSQLDVFVPLGWEPAVLADRDSRGYDVIARPRQGLTLEQAQGEMSAIAREIAASHPATHGGWSALVQPVQAHYLSYFRPAMRVLLAAVGVVLLITCANLANLLLARGVGRQRELAIRAALGARAGQLMRHVLAESVMLSVLGGGLGIALAWWSRGLLVAILPGELQSRLPGGVAAIGVDATLLVFVTGVAIATGVVAGGLPALQAAYTDAAEALKRGGTVLGGRPRRLRNALVAWQVGLATLALVASLLLAKSLLRASDADLGFRPAGVLRAGVFLTRQRYPTESHRAARYGEMLQRVSGLPGVEAAALTNELLVRPNALGGPFVIQGRPDASPADSPTANLRLISPAYFQAMEISLLEGRAFTEADSAGAPGVVILSRTVAAQHWPAGQALGQRIRIGPPQGEGPWLTVVGIAADVRHPLGRGESRIIYQPLAQAPTPFAFLLVRTSGEPQGAQPSVEQAVRWLDPQLILRGAAPMEDLIAEELSHKRFTTILVILFGVLSLGLAVLGVYGSSSYAVGQRMQEMGLRVALVASPRDVLRLVLRQGMTTVCWGLAIGLVGVAALARLPLLTSQLQGVEAFDPAVYFASALVLSAATLAGCFWPARRATRVDPMVALRYE